MRLWLAFLLFVLASVSVTTAVPYPSFCDTSSVNSPLLRLVFKAFNERDSKHDGRLKESELQVYYAAHSEESGAWSPQVWTTLLSKMDYDADEVISLNEWVVSNICQICGASNPCESETCVVSEDMLSYTCV